MTVEEWLQVALADADRRGLAAVKPALEALSRATATLRASFAEDARGAETPSQR